MLNKTLDVINESVNDTRRNVWCIQQDIFEAKEGVLEEFSHFKTQAKKIEAILSNMEHNNDLLLYSRIQDVKLGKE